MFIVYLIVACIIVFSLLKLAKANRNSRIQRQTKDDNLNYYSVLDSKPRAISEVRFKRYTGVVLHTTRNASSTGLSSITTTTVEREIFLKLENGDEFSTKIGNDNILIREGNRISLIKMYNDGPKFLWIYFFNHDTKEEIYFNPYSTIRNITKKGYTRDNFYTRFGTLGEQHEPEFLADFEKLKERIRIEMENS